jgi:type IV pilus biogenesis protein CpaD/CtpE
MKILTTLAILALMLAPLTGCTRRENAPVNSPESEATEGDLDVKVEETGEAIEEGAERLAKGAETALEEAAREVKEGARKD